MSMIVLTAGGGNYPGVEFRYWRDAPFTHSSKGFLSVMLTCIFAMAVSENRGLVAAEMANPKKLVPRAPGLHLAAPRALLPARLAHGRHKPEPLRLERVRRRGHQHLALRIAY
ncbi:hypothetical protein DL764_008371 [Monosporascus ibericus]|uniref:Amino acid permease/ SLC12A domain-containing protein n=1 Tax=Monosporascus ibericus TaxID=155417 RepID=A0A4Q4T0P4_9PEZI|nr:hypothetical protein DL764_008371 [Monosporascus ibericus]